MFNILKMRSKAFYYSPSNSDIDQEGIEVEVEDFNRISPCLPYYEHYEWTQTRPSLNINGEEEHKWFELISNFFNIYQPSVKEAVLNKYLIQSLRLTTEGLRFASLPHKLFSILFVIRYIYNPGDLL